MLYNLLAVDFGPFNPLMGCISVLAAVAYAISFGFFGKRKRWQIGQNELPITATKMVAMVSVIGTVIIYINARPNRIDSMTRELIAFGSIALGAYILYYLLSMAWSCKQTIGVELGEPVIAIVLSGVWMTKKAKEKKHREQLTKEDLLFTTGGKIEAVWDNLSIGTARVLLMLLFITIIGIGSAAIATAGCLLQVNLTGKPATEVFKRSEVPGFSTDSTKQK